jgi:tight adherence protein B
MIGSLPPLVVGLAVCLLLIGGLAAVVAGTVPSHRSDRRSSRRRARGRIPAGRVVIAIVAMLTTLVLTRWVVLAMSVGALAMLYDRLLGDHRADEERARVEGIAKWLEDLRDTLRGSAVGAEEALEQVAARPPVAIQTAMQTYLRRRRQGFRTEVALADLADDLAHPTADAAVAAIRLVTTGASGAGRLHATVQSLAEAARDEVRARERVDRTRAVIGAVLVLYLKVAGGDLLAPYDTPTGQVMLAIPLALWLGCILWLRSLCRYEVARGTRVAREAGVS